MTIPYYPLGSLTANAPENIPSHKERSLRLPCIIFQGRFLLNFGRVFFGKKWEFRLDPWHILCISKKHNKNNNTLERSNDLPRKHMIGSPQIMIMIMIIYALLILPSHHPPAWTKGFSTALDQLCPACPFHLRMNPKKQDRTDFVTKRWNRYHHGNPKLSFLGVMTHILRA